MEIKIGISYISKEARYHSGNSKRLKEKFIYLGTNKNFMHSFILIAEEELNLSQSEKHYLGGDEDAWITFGIRDCFPEATFVLCRFHLFKCLRESLLGEKEKHRIIKDLLLSDFYSYISCNQEGITNQVTLEDKDIARTGAIESNVKLAISNYFKKQGKS